MEKKNPDIEDLLDSCLDELNRGTPIEELLEKHPDHREELQSLLSLSVGLASVPKPEPGQAALHDALLRSGAAISRRKASGTSLLPSWLVLPKYVVVRALVVVGLLSLITIATVAASSKALPGDLLYPVKLTSERIQLILSATSQGKAELHLTFSEGRMQELLTKFRKDGEIDKKVLGTMLREATRALDDITRVPEERQEPLYQKYAHFCAYQKEALQSLESRVGDRYRHDLSQAVQDCKNRGERSQHMMEKGKHFRMRRHRDQMYHE